VMSVINRIWGLSLLAMWVPVAIHAQVTPLGSEFQVNTYTENDQGFPAVCTDAAGNFVVVWSSYGPANGPLPGQDGDLAGIFARRYASDGTARSAEFQVNTHTYDVQAFPAIACAQAGAFVVVWSSYGQDGDNYGVFGQRYDSAGVPAGTEFQVNTFTSTSQDYAAIASDGAGNFVVAWASYIQDGDGFGVFGRRYASDGAPLTSEFQVNTWFTAKQGSPAVVGDADGRFVVVWASYGQDGDEGGVFGKRYDSAGNVAGTEFQVNSYTPGRQYEPSISADGAGNFVVVWTSTEGDGYESGIFGQRFGSDGGFVGTEFLVNTYTSGTEYAPAVGVDPAGNFVVTWTTYQYYSPDGDVTGVFGRSFESTGVPVGSEFQVNTYTYSYQSYPAISAQGGSKFVVTWESYGQDGFGFGVIGRRYNANVLLGDCNGDGRVTTNELVLSVYIALGTFPISDCPAIDPSGSGSVTVNALVGAVANSLAT